MENFDWSSFMVRVPIRAPIPDLYKAWATRRGIETWFLRMSAFKSPAGEIRSDEAFIEPGDSYEWLWHGWPDDVMEKGKILDCNGKDFLQFSFGKAGNCTVHIKTLTGETMVELVQDIIPTDDESKKNYHLGCKTGWTFYLANLKSIMEGGIDLRNRNETLKEVINS